MRDLRKANRGIAYKMSLGDGELFPFHISPFQGSVESIFSARFFIDYLTLPGCIKYASFLLYLQENLHIMQHFILNINVVKMHLNEDCRNDLASLQSSFCILWLFLVAAYADHLGDYLTHIQRYRDSFKILAHTFFQFFLQFIQFIL